ncbi:MAG TPA: 3-dehydroquinate synthase [Candidatus Binataceae bacterium]|nr:3-dehydroquinate synthase [Candidatus Binataceae bacterium]
MRTFRVELGRDAHPVHVGSGILDRVGQLARDAGLKLGRAALITDSNVAKIYGARVAASLNAAGFDAITIEIPAGEASKSLEMLATLYDRMTDAELDRQSVVFALGGGVTGDLAAFAAATYLRGIPVVQIPTTVVAQVDSALGGKSGVNHRRAKNLIGAFYQPRMILADVESLKTLPEREFREGLAEVIKYGAIMDAPMVADLERDLDAILRREMSVLEWMVERSLRHKAYVVENDEHESGLRKILNFGHTIGHAIEASSGYGNYLHGEAVAIGMVSACAISRKFAGLAEDDSRRLCELIRNAGLPIALPSQWRSDDFIQALRLDKKRVDRDVEFIVIDGIGHAMPRKLSFDDLLSEIF